MQIKNLNTKNGYILLAVAAVLVILGIVALFASAGGNKAAPTATVSVNDIYTQVAQTFAAQQATQQALNPPTASPFPTFPLASPTIASTQAPIPTAANTSPAATAQGCDSSLYLSDVTIPDGTVMTPGQTFVKTWLVQNTGTCTWDTSYKIGFGFGEAMGGTNTALTTTVAPGAQAQVSVNLTVPATTGNLTGTWRMMNKQGAFFGTNLTVVINVSGPTATSTAGTPAATNTPPPTATLTPSPTAAP